ncbi:MAG TPA: N-acetyl-gamma-glutamyl-phosphate reductase [Mucilaginibacter sp.]|jgi:N-acetyl-gamma-glutamyl-phosphate reductase
MSERIKIGIIGGAGYVAGELLRILVNHPFANIKYVQSKSQQDKLVSSIHTDLEGDCLLRFVDTWTADVDVLFLCGGHQQSNIFLTGNQVPSAIKIIDMSQDFRLGRTKNSHGRNFVYGLSEYNRKQIKSTDSVANPGCFATSITLSLLPVIPLVKEEVHIHAITGSTGSGQSLSPGVNFNWRNNNVSIYKAFSHQHLDEINETLRDVNPGFKAAVNFLPVRGNFTRGIFTSLYFKSGITADELQSRFKTRYQNDPFVVITDVAPDLKQAVNTNKILINAAKYGDKVLIISAMDNLLKGASGQAVQNMNLLFGLDETAGLKLKSVAF